MAFAGSKGLTRSRSLVLVECPVPQARQFFCCTCTEDDMGRDVFAAAYEAAKPDLDMLI